MPNRTKKPSPNMPLRIKSIRKRMHLTQKDFAKMLDKGESTVRMWELGHSEPDAETITILSEKSGKPTDYIIGKPFKLRIPMENWRSDYVEDYHNASLEEKEILKFEYGRGYFDNDNTVLGELSDDDEKVPTIEANAIFLEENKIYMIPIFESVSAGFGTMAQNCIVDHTPLIFSSHFEAQETICIKVKGDSMYPKIEEGDIIQVHKQDSVDSGSIAVVLLDGEEGLVKKVVYGNTWIELHSINPMYPVMRFEKSDMLRLRVLGLVKKIIKDV